MRLSSLRPAYLVPRLQQISFCRRRPDAPWLTEGAVLLLEAWLRPEDAGLEWGSGRSTLWFAQRVGRLLSVEADRHWYERVKAQLGERGCKNVDYRHVPCELEEVDEPTAHPYADVARELPDQALDFVLVDGHIRVACVEAALIKLKPGGLLILDNANRFIPNQLSAGFTTVHEPRAEARTERWGRVVEQLHSWRAIITSDRIWDTRFWIKPGT
jgi:predicted O-methyltransferase YrrM